MAGRGEAGQGKGTECKEHNMTSYRYLPTINTLRLSPEDTQLLLEAVACQLERMEEIESPAAQRDREVLEQIETLLRNALHNFHSGGQADGRVESTSLNGTHGRAASGR